MHARIIGRHRHLLLAMDLDCQWDCQVDGTILQQMEKHGWVDIFVCEFFQLFNVIYDLAHGQMMQTNRSIVLFLLQFLLLIGLTEHRIQVILLLFFHRLQVF